MTEFLNELLQAALRCLGLAGLALVATALIALAIGFVFVCLACDSDDAKGANIKAGNHVDVLK